MSILLLLCLGQVTISAPVTYPVEVYNMTDAQFFQWATEYNTVQKVELEKRPQTEPQYLFGDGLVTDQSWSGRNDNGFWRPAGDYYGSSNQQTTMYQRRWHNPYYTGPGPLVIVNPFCKPVK